MLLINEKRHWQQGAFLKTAIYLSRITIHFYA